MIPTKNNPREAYQHLNLIATHCELCGQENFIQIHDNDRYNMGIQTVICTNCSFIYSNPRPTESSMIEFYSTNYRDYYSGVMHPEQHYKEHLPDYLRAKSLVQYYKKNVQPLPVFSTLKALDIGSHTGLLLYHLGNGYLNADLYGIEPKKEFADFTAKKTGAHVLAGDWAVFEKQYQHLMGQFDLITLNHVLEHLYDPIEKLKSIRTFLKPEGVLIIEVPDALSNRWDDPIEMFHIAHHQHFTSQTLKQCLQASGFKLIRMDNELRAVRCIAQPSPIQAALETVDLEDVKKIRLRIRKRFESPSLIQRIRKKLRRSLVWLKVIRLFTHIQVYGIIKTASKLMRHLAGRIENSYYHAIYLLNKNLFHSYKVSEDQEKQIRNVIEGRNVLILGSGPSAAQLNNIPEDWVVLTCNEGLSLYKNITGSHKPVGLFLITMSKIKRLPKILLDLNHSEALLIGVDHPKALASKLSSSNSCIFKDDGMSPHMLQQLLPNIDLAKLKGRSKHPWTSSGIRLLQYALFYRAKNIYLSGIDFGQGGYAWGALHGPWMHQDIDVNICKKLSDHNQNIRSLSLTSPSSEFFTSHSTNTSPNS